MFRFFSSIARPCSKLASPTGPTFPNPLANGLLRVILFPILRYLEFKEQKDTFVMNSSQKIEKNGKSKHVTKKRENTKCEKTAWRLFRNDIRTWSAHVWNLKYSRTFGGTYRGTHWLVHPERNRTRYRNIAPVSLRTRALMFRFRTLDFDLYGSL